jgi:hypothetical protein
MTWKFGEHNDNTFGFYYTFSNGVKYYFYTEKFIESAQVLELAHQPKTHAQFIEYISKFFALFDVSLTLNSDDHMYQFETTTHKSACNKNCGASFLIDNSELFNFVSVCCQSEFIARADLSKNWCNQPINLVI